MRKQQKAATKPKRRRPAEAGRSPSSRKQKLIELVTRERDEALAREAATAEILSSISGLTDDPHPMFETIVQNVLRLFGTRFAIVTLVHGDMIEIAGFAGEPAFENFAALFPVPLDERSLAGKTMLSGRATHITPIIGNPQAPPLAQQSARAFGFNSQLATPMIRNGKVLGAIVTAHRDAAAFNDKQVSLIKTFADQAAIAIENTRLVNELRQRTDDLTKSLEQQTATGEVLKVISSSPGALDPVFQAMLRNAVRICEAKFGNLFLYDGEVFRVAAMHDAPLPFAEERRRNPVLRPNPGTSLGRIVETRQPVQIADAQAEPAYQSDPVRRLGFLELAGARTFLNVPMLKDNDLVGAITIYRQEVRPFTDKQIELVTNFAAQAVIAIENARLLSELRQRTNDLTEALEQQTATSEVLKVISSSPGELQPVFAAMLENATRICEAKFGSLFLCEGDAFRFTAHHNAPPAWVESRGRDPLVRPPPGSGLALVAESLRTVQIPDITQEVAYRNRDPMIVAGVELAGFRTVVAVPMLKDNKLVGCINIYRQEVSPFSDKQIELVSNFAAQAVIAIENTRLLNELRQRTDDLTEALEQQTATSEVLKVISGSPGDLEPVFQSMLANAVRICGAKFGVLYHYRDKEFHPAALANAPEAYAGYVRGRGAFVPQAENALDRLLRTKRLVHIPDSSAEAVPVAAIRLAGACSLILVPMLQENELRGAITIYRQEAGPFTGKQIELLTNFAAQAVIAIENARLLNELRQRTDDLTESLEQQTATSEVLKVISSSPGELGPVFEAMLGNAVRICGAKFGILFRHDDGAFRPVALHNAPPELIEFHRQRGSFVPPPGMPLERLLRTRTVVHSVDQASDQVLTPSVTHGGARTHIAVPMLKDNELIGAIVIYHTEVFPFTDKQIELLTNFAAQAVIAIENTRLLNELRESLAQQTATADVLKVISRSAGELQPVFEAMLANAVRICAAQFGNLVLFDGKNFRAVALHDVPPVYADAIRAKPVLEIRPGDGLNTVLATKTVVQIADITVDPAYAGLRLSTLAGARTLLVVPMLKNNEVIGAVNIYRQEVRPFTDKQIELVQNFAAQAVIAIENTRLLNELRQRTDDLSEALDQQTATSEVLKVISSSPGDLEPVFQAMLENATRICEAEFGMLFRSEGATFHFVAEVGTPPGLAEFLRQRGSFQPQPGGLFHRAVMTREVIHNVDETLEAVPMPSAKLGGARSIVCVPMLKDDQLVGAITIYRQEVRPFTDKQIELVQNFAAQAVIAIENTRLLNELRQRTDDLTEALEQQTATSEVLKVISGSPGELEPVFNAMLENATRICGAGFGMMWQAEGEGFRGVAFYNLPAGLIEERERHKVIYPGPEIPLSQVARTRQLVHIADIRTEAAYSSGFAPFVALADKGGARTLLVVPLLREDALIGALAIYRQEVRPFTDKQIELVQNFAAQAVIAIENTRLLSELRESLQQQTATADVLKVISRSTFDLQAVLDTLTESAARLCRAERSAIRLLKDSLYQYCSGYGVVAGQQERMAREPVPTGSSSLTGRVGIERKSIQILDALADPDPDVVRRSRLGNVRTLLGVPLLREGLPIGVLLLQRSVVQQFSSKEIELAETFANQAVIAIENVRLFESVEARTRELAQSLEDLQTAQDRLVQTQKLASLGQLTAGIAHEIKNPLNFVNNFSSLSTEMLDELQEALQRGQFDHKTRAEIDELTETLRANLDKIEQHGKRADSIVKNMLLHSREGSGEHRPVDINAVVEESLNLAYHGARAEKQAFNITLERAFDPAAGEVDVFPQEITRVLLNLISNGFYAATKRKAEASGGGYEPTLTATTKSLGDRVEIMIRDNGTGIPPEVKDKMFNPFFTTKPAGEGTGLGLSLSHDIIVKQHAGTIEVDTQPGEFTEFRIFLPRAAATIAKSGGRP